MRSLSPGSSGSSAVSNKKTANKFKCSECNVVINELLAFITDKVDTLHEKGLIQICSSAYTTEEIENARHLALSLLAPSKKVMRRKEGSEEKSLQEIIKLIKEFEPADLPVFVAKTLSKLPPVTFDHVDVTAFLKEMTLFKSELDQLKSDKRTEKHSCADDIDIIKREMEEIKQLLSNTQLIVEKKQSLNYLEVTPKTKSNATGKRRTKVPSISENSTPKCQRTKSPLRESARHASTRERTHSGTYTCARGRARKQTDSGGSFTHTPSYRDIVVDKRQRNTNSILRIGDAELSQQDDFILVQNKKRRKINNLCGSAPSSSKILVAQLPAAVYVSRLAKTTNVQQLKEYVQEQGEECIDVQLLNQKNETDFSSFKVIIPKIKINKFLSNDFWPEGVKYRLFRERFTRTQKKTNENK